MEQTFHRETWAEINLDKIEYNIKQMKQTLPNNSQIMAVVKANAYGHGAVQVSKVALKSGATFLAVALLEEALTLRQAGIVAPILVLGWVPPKSALIAAEHNITLMFFQKEWIKTVNTYTFKKELKLHMKWDTGGGRIGLRTDDELIELVQELNKNKHIHLTGVYTHFATADEEDLTYYHQQHARFKQLLSLLNKLWPRKVAIHIGNSAASIRFPKEMHAFIRLGIAMYGLYPSVVIKREKRLHLKEAFSLHSNLIHVKQIAAGESISYGATYTAKENEWIGTIPIGYADGWARRLQGMDVLVAGIRSPIVGRICMDLTMVRLDKEYPVGTKVTLIGEQMGEIIEMEEVANYLGTINYEVPCMISHRVPRVWIETK